MNMTSSAMVGKTIYPSMNPSIFELKFPNKDIEDSLMINFIYPTESCTLYSHFDVLKQCR